jgi:hypothetical protein
MVKGASPRSWRLSGNYELQLDGANLRSSACTNEHGTPRRWRRGVRRNRYTSGAEVGGELDLAFLHPLRPGRPYHLEPVTDSAVPASRMHCAKKVELWRIDDAARRIAAIDPSSSKP